MLIHKSTRYFWEKSFEDAEDKFGMVELLLWGQGKKYFMRFKKTVTKGLVASDSTTSIATLREITENYFKLTLEKFKNWSFKNFAVRYQVNYLQQNLHKPVGEGCRVCREAPGDQQLFRLFPRTWLQYPFNWRRFN